MNACTSTRSSDRRQSPPALVPGEVAEIRFGLLPTSALACKGHPLRIAIAGHDASTFARIPAEGTPTITLHPESDPRHPTGMIETMPDDLTKHLRDDVEAVSEPRAQALCEATAEVLIGLRTAYDHFEQGEETAWRR